MTYVELRTGINSNDKENYWDDLTLIIKSSPIQLIRIRDRFEALELDRNLTINDYENHMTELSVKINDVIYIWEYEVWQGVLEIINQWSQEYMIAESELIETNYNTENYLNSHITLLPF